MKPSTLLEQFERDFTTSSIMSRDEIKKRFNYIAGLVKQLEVKNKNYERRTHGSSTGSLPKMPTRMATESR